MVKLIAAALIVMVALLWIIGQVDRWSQAHIIVVGR